jgi:CIC family chloride channel protein
LADRGIDIAGGRTGLEMMERSISTILHQDFTKLTKDMTAETSISKMLEDEVTEAYVLEEGNTFLGKVTLQSLLMAKASDKLSPLLQNDPITIKSDASLQQAMEVAVQFIGESIPIIDRDNNQFLGVVTEADLFRDYLALQNKMVDLERR